MLRSLLAGTSVFALLLAGSLPIRAQFQAPATSQQTQGQLAQEPPVQEQPVQEPSAEEQPAAAPEVTSQEVSQEDLEKFAQAVKAIQTIEEQAQTEMTQALENEGLNFDQYRTILQGQENPEAQAASEVTQDQKESFKRVNNRVAEIQEAAQSKMQEAVEAQGLKVERFQEISMAIQQNPTLREQIQQLLQS